MTNTTRRQMLVTAGLSLAAFGAGTQVKGREISNEKNLPDFSGTPAEVTESGGWKYLPIDPQKTADDSYAMFMDGACHYASFRAIITNVAKALQATGNEQDALLAKHYLAFPFYMMVYGQAGLAYYGSLCGAINGSAAALSVFVPDRTDKFALIQNLNVFHEETPLPIYVPKDDKYPGKMPPTVAKSILCHLSLDQWVKGTEYTMEGHPRVERCIRLTCDMVIKTVNLLNEYHANNARTVTNRTPVLPEVQSCIQCHAYNKGRCDSIATMNCAACHAEPKTGSSCPKK